MARRGQVVTPALAVGVLIVTVGGAVELPQRIKNEFHNFMHISDLTDLDNEIH